MFVTSQGGATARFRRALQTGNLLLIRAAAAELPRIGLGDAAAILLVIEQRAPETFERAALRWLARLCQESRRVCLEDAAVVAAALAQLPALGARQTLAALCQRLDEREAAAVFAGR
jgi:hypothetical protein